MSKFKQARQRRVTYRTKQTRKKRKSTWGQFATSNPKSRIPIVLPADTPCQSNLFSRGKCAASSLKNTVLSTGNLIIPSLRNAAFLSCNMAFLSVRNAVGSTVNVSFYMAMNTALSARNFALACVRNAVKALARTMFCLFWWCWKILRKCFDMLRDAFFPSHIYLRELTTVKQQVLKLEMELSRLQEAVQSQSGGTVGSFENASCSRCCKVCMLDSRLPAISTDFSQPAVPSSPPVAPSLPPSPPPPPPPPPPPLPPPAFFMQKPVVILKKVGNSNALKDAPLKKEGSVQVTLKDLLNVKLRKVSGNVGKKKEVSPRKGCIPLVRVSDLQGINLRINSTLNQNRITHFVIQSPSKSQLDLRKHLKKVNLKRSPGGTPMYDRENKENGTGLTPIMTRALKQKFQVAHPKSPPPKYLPIANRSFEDLC